FAIYALNFAKIQPERWMEHFARSPLDPGYTILTILIRTVTDLPYAVFLAAAVLTVVPIYITIKKQSLNPTLALALYVMLAFYVHPFNAVRQGIAIAMNVWASSFLRSKPLVF